MKMQAIQYMMEKHKHQTRMGGDPYAIHPVTVAVLVEEKGFTEDYLTTALFHDLLEDTDATEEEILQLSNEPVLVAVKLLTKTKGYQMESYIEAISKNPIAKMVKLADRLHNLRSAPLASESFRRKYIKETKAYYLDLAIESPFEHDIHEALHALEQTLL